jgi:cobalt-zinc-cadmium efflux system membrane fusion protein
MPARSDAWLEDQGGMMIQRLTLAFLMTAYIVLALAGCRGIFQKGSQETESQSKPADSGLDSLESDDAGQLAPGWGRRGSNSGRAPGWARGRARNRTFSLSPTEAKSLGIQTVKAAYRQIQSLHSAMGKVLAPQTRMAKVSYAFPARISAIHANIGDWVEKGQRVLTLQSEEVGRAKSEYYKAIADLALAKSNYEREKRLYDRGVGAQKNTLATEAEYKVAQASLEAAEKKLHVLGFSEDDVEAIAQIHQINPEIHLFAPIRGKIIEHNAVLGGMIDQSSELLTIMDPTVLWVDAEIFERDIAKIHIGQQVNITLPAYPGKSFKGKLSYISEVLNEQTRTITVRTEVQNPELKLKAGMFANVEISLNSPQAFLTVPSEAVLDDDNDRIVFVKSDSQYGLRIVTVSHVQNGFCTIAEGLREGELVVTKGNYMLKSKLYDELLKKTGVH